MSRGPLPLPRSHMPRHGCGSLRRDDDAGLRKGKGGVFAGHSGNYGVAWRGGLTMAMVRGWVLFVFAVPLPWVNCLCARVRACEFGVVVESGYGSCFLFVRWMDRGRDRW